MKISIDSPCHENWDNMTPNEQGAFCLSCQKNVVDFSRKTLHEIKSFFKELPLTEKVCGRFDENQLEELSFDDFFKRFRKWRLFHKMAVICFFVFGLSLFSCSQTPKPEDHVLMGDVAVVDTLQPPPVTPVTTPTVTPKPTHIMGGPRVMPSDTTRQKPATKPKPVKPEMIKGEVYIAPDKVDKPKTCTPDTTTEKKIMGKMKRE
ncbi:MAG: hypothetical protein JST26_00025 [Bacteroidetes bacterium]|nr:hypothetical protein [Bacteroidota bacterium]